MSKKGQRHKDLTETYLSGNLDEDKLRGKQRFNRTEKYHQQNKTARTTLARLAESEHTVDIDALPVGRVVQVHSVFGEVVHEGRMRLCVVRKTLASTSETRVVVGDLVKFTAVGESEGVIERVEPRVSILTRADVRTEKDKIVGQIPIIANADQMLIVASLMLPKVKWGLIDRMIVAAMTGNLRPILCLNKIDLADGKDSRISSNHLASARVEASSALDHYRGMGITVLQTSVTTREGLDELSRCLAGKTTVLAGHSGVGKSSLITAVQADLKIRVGEISNYNQKGRHTTTSARIYNLVDGGSVVDTPGVKLFGLLNVTTESLIEFFPDVAAGTAPEWRVESYERVLQSIS